MKKLLLATTVILAGFALSSAAFAQNAPDAGAPGASAGETTPGGAEPTNIPGHPRVNEVDRRDDRQQQRIDRGEADGQLNKGQAAHDQARLDHQEAAQQRQEAAHGGHLTRGELHHDNHSLNRSSRNIHRERRNGARRERHERRHHR